MASWQPPIPAGALYSKAARNLGPALPLLAYCYDKVRRDGTFKLSLKEVAGDMDEAYPTVKRWWQLLADGPFFKSIENHGRNGLLVTFKDVWLDWRILSTRTENTFGTEAGSEMISNNEDKVNRGVIGIINGSQSGSEMIPDDQCIKVLITTDQAGVERDDAKAPRTPKNRPNKPPTPIPIREALADVCRIGNISTREQQLQVNQSAAQIWKEQQKAGATPDSVADDIRYVAAHFAREDWRGKKGEAPTPARIREHWGTAMRERNQQPVSPMQRPIPEPEMAGRILTPEERRAAMAAATERAHARRRGLTPTG